MATYGRALRQKAALDAAGSKLCRCGHTADRHFEWGPTAALVEDNGLFQIVETPHPNYRPGVFHCVECDCPSYQPKAVA